MSLIVFLVFLDFTVRFLPSLRFHVLMVSIPMNMDLQHARNALLDITVLIQLNHLHHVYQEHLVFLEVLTVWLVSLL